MFNYIFSSGYSLVICKYNTAFTVKAELQLTCLQCLDEGLIASNRSGYNLILVQRYLLCSEQTAVMISIYTETNSILSKLISLRSCHYLLPYLMIMKKA